MKQMTTNEETIYVCALRYASGRHTYMPYLVIDEIISHLPQFPHPQNFLREIEMRVQDAERGFNEWDECGERNEFMVKLKKAVEEEIERRKGT